MAMARIVCLTLALLLADLVAAQTRGFSAKIYRRDSPASPFYDPALTQTERIRRSVARSIARASHFRPDSPQASITAGRGEYLMNISLGTPAFPIVAVADTGSDLIWTQCAPCTGCYEQKYPLFDPKKSTTFRKIPCQSPACRAGSGCTEDNSCGYVVRYADGSYTKGVVSTETITLESTTPKPVKLPKSVFGCGFDNRGTFTSEESGIIGLGGGAQSLVTQLGSQVDGKFSYCLVPLDAEGDGTSTINFGNSAAASGPGVVTTPIVKKYPDTFYYLTLEGFVVGKILIPFFGFNNSVEEGNIVIDSGTTLVLLPTEFYSQFQAAVAEQISAEPVPDPQGFFGLCYNHNSEFQPPSIMAMWAGGPVELTAANTFVKITDEVVCLAFAPWDDLAIFGNLAQMNFLVGYDKVGGTVSFKPTNCATA